MSGRDRYAVSYYYCHFPHCSHTGYIEGSHTTPPTSLEAARKDLRDEYYQTLEELRREGVRIKKAVLATDHFVIAWDNGRYDCFFSGRIIRVSNF